MHLKKILLGVLLSAFFVVSSVSDTFAYAMISAETASGETNVSDTETAPDSSAALHPAAKSALIMEAKTGTVIFEQNADERLRPASVTKIMTLLLIFEGLEKMSIIVCHYQYVVILCLLFEPVLFLQAYWRFTATK